MEHKWERTGTLAAVAAAWPDSFIERHVSPLFLGTVAPLDKRHRYRQLADREFADERDFWKRSEF